MGAWADVLTAWQKAAFAVVYDVCLIATMIAIEALGHAPTTVAARTMAPAATRPEIEPDDSRETEAANIVPPAPPKLVVNGSARPAGSIPKILSDTLEPGKGSRVEMEEAYATYAGECTCLGKVYLLNVRLVPLMATPSRLLK